MALQIRQEAFWKSRMFLLASDVSGATLGDRAQRGFFPVIARTSPSSAAPSTGETPPERFVGR